MGVRGCVYIFLTCFETFFPEKIETSRRSSMLIIWITWQQKSDSIFSARVVGYLYFCSNGTKSGICFLVSKNKAGWAHAGKQTKSKGDGKKKRTWSSRKVVLRIFASFLVFFLSRFLFYCCAVFFFHVFAEFVFEMAINVFPEKRFTREHIIVIFVEQIWKGRRFNEVFKFAALRKGAVVHTCLTSIKEASAHYAAF